MIVARYVVPGIRAKKRLRPEGTPDSGRARHWKSLAGLDLFQRSLRDEHTFTFVLKRRGGCRIQPRLTVWFYP